MLFRSRVDLPLNMPAATKSITLQEDKPFLLVTSMCARSANFASASDFAISKCPNGSEITHFHEIQHHGPKWRNLSLLKICARSVSGRETWPIRIRMPNVELEKYTELERIGDFFETHKFSTEILHIVCGPLATRHARCHKEYYSPRGQAVSTSHFRVHAQR